MGVGPLCVAMGAVLGAPPATLQVGATLLGSAAVILVGCRGGGLARLVGFAALQVLAFAVVIGVSGALGPVGVSGLEVKALGLFLELSVVGGIAQALSGRPWFAAVAAVGVAWTGQFVHELERSASRLDGAPAYLATAALAPIPDLRLFDSTTLVRGERVDARSVWAGTAYGAAWLVALAAGAALAGAPAARRDPLAAGELSDAKRRSS